MPRLKDGPSERLSHPHPHRNTGEGMRGDEKYRPVARRGIWEAPPLVEAGPDDCVVSYSELDTYRQCPLKHFIAYRSRWVKTDRPSDHALSKGTLWHAVMEQHYLGIQKFQHLKPSPAVATRRAKWIQEQINPLLMDTQTGHQTDVQALIQWMYEGYLEMYGYDEQWKILGVEHRIQRRLRSTTGEPSPYLLKGKLDLVVEDRATGKVWIVDHKSGANLPGDQELDLDDQFGLYLWLVQDAGVPVAGVIHDAVRTTRNQADFPEYAGKSKPQTLQQRMRRTLMARGERELVAVASDAYAVACNAHPEALQVEPLPMYSSPDPRQCGWKCDYLDAHLMARKGRPLDVALSELGFEQDYTRH